MSAYADLVEQPILEPVVLFEIDIGEPQDFWIALEAGIWMFKVTNVTEGVTYDFQNGAFCYGSFENAGGPEDLGTNEVIKIVNSFEVAGEQYTSVSGLANLRSTNKSFYYDAATTIIYVHFDGFDPPDVFTNKKIGVTAGFSTRAIYLDDNYYEERLKSAPQISFSKDPLFWGILRFSENTIDLLNGDGYFDDFVQLDIYGQPARVKFGGPDLAYADFRTLFTGYVEKFSVNAERFSVSVADDRKKLSRKLPVNYWDATTYADIKSSNVGKPIPLAWGDIRNAPVVCTNEDESGTPATYSFKICDTTNHPIDAITKVYVNGVEVTPDSTTLATATFVLLTADYDPGDKVTVDFTGYTKTGLNILNNAGCERDELVHIRGETTGTANNMLNERVSTEQYSGGYSLRMTKTVGAGTDGNTTFVDGLGTTDMHGLTAGKTYRLKSRVKVPSTGGPLVGEVAIYIAEYYSGSWHYTSDAATVQDQWEELDTGDVTLNAGTTGFFAMMWMNPDAELDELIYYDNVELIAVDEAWSILNALDVIVDLLDDYAGVTYSADTFDTTEWAAATALVPVAGLFVSKQKTIVKLIEEACVGAHGSFLVQNDGKYTFKITDDSAASAMTILQDEQFGDPGVEFKTDEFLTSAVIQYNQDQAEDEYEEYPDTSRESDVFDRYQRYRERSFETLLVTSADAALLASDILDLSEEIPILFSVVTTMKASTLEVSDNIVLQVDRVTREWFGNQKCELVGIDYDLNSMRVGLIGRRIEAA